MSVRDKRFIERREDKTYQVKQLWDIHHEIIRRLVIGQRSRQIAEDLNITPQTVSNVRNSPIVKRQIQMLQAQRDSEAISLKDRIDEIAPKAIKLLERKIEDDLGGDEVTQVGVRAALGTLDFAVPKRSEIAVKHGVDVTLLEEIKERARKSKMLVEKTPDDVEFHVVE